MRQRKNRRLKGLEGLSGHWKGSKTIEEGFLARFVEYPGQWQAGATVAGEPAAPESFVNRRFVGRTVQTGGGLAVNVRHNWSDPLALRRIPSVDDQFDMQSLGGYRSGSTDASRCRLRALQLQVI